VELPGTLAAVLAQYPLEDPRDLGAFDASTRNDNVRVLRRARRRGGAPAGPPQSRSGARAFPDSLPAAPRGRWLPRRADLESTSGEAVVVDEEGLPWALFGLVEGEHYGFGRLAHAREAGRRLAEFHDATNYFVISIEAH